MRLNRIWPLSLTLVGLCCATKPPKSGEEPERRASASQALQDTALKSRVETLLSGYEYVPSEEEWKKLGPGALPVLENIYRDNQALPTMRMKAVSSMAFVDSPSAVQVLQSIVADPKAEPRYRSKAILALGHLGSDVALTSLLPRLEDPDMQIREASARALGQAGKISARQPLESRLEIEEDEPVREAIQQALTKLEP